MRTVSATSQRLQQPIHTLQKDRQSPPHHVWGSGRRHLRNGRHGIRHAIAGPAARARSEAPARASAPARVDAAALRVQIRRALVLALRPGRQRAARLVALLGAGNKRRICGDGKQKAITDGLI